METNPKILTLSELITKSLPLSGTSSLTPSSTDPPFHHQHRQSSKPTSSISFQNPSPKTLPSLTYPTLIIGTLALPSESNSTRSCNCFSFSDDPSSICCDVLSFDVKIIGKKLHVLSWNFIPSKCGGSWLLEIIRWKLPNSDFKLIRCSNIDAFPLNSPRDEIFEPRSCVFGRLESVSPVTVVPCKVQKCHMQKSTGQCSSDPRNVSGFLAEFVVCQCKLCTSKVPVETLCNSRGDNVHLFALSVTVYFFQSAWSWNPLLCKLLGKVVCITGLKKKLIFIGKDDSCLMFITTDKTASLMPLLPLKLFPFPRDEIMGKGESGAYSGIVTGVYMQGMVVELDEKVWLLLTDRLLALPHSIRVGALICVRNVHFVRPRFSWMRMLLLGTCSKTNVNMKSFSPLESKYHIRSQTQSMLGKFIESLVFSARLWFLLTFTSFKKKFAGVFSEKEILGSKHSEGVAQMYAKSLLPSSVFRPRHGIFMEFCKHKFCGCGNEPLYSNLNLVPPLSSFINHCEIMWVNHILQMQKDSETIKNKLYWCEGKSYCRLTRRIVSSEDIGVVLMGTLQVSPSSGRLQMVDASGSVDVVIPDMPSDYHASSIYEVRHYSVVIEGLPETADASVVPESESFSLRSIFHYVLSKGKIKPASVYVHFYMKNSTCLNICFHRKCMDWSDNFVGIKDGLFHLLVVTHKFPALQKLHVNSAHKPNSFVEAILLPWNLFLPVDHKDTYVTGFCEENLNEPLEYTYGRNSYEEHCHKRPKVAHGSTKTMTTTLKDTTKEATDGSFGCFSIKNSQSIDHESVNMDSSHELSCFVFARGFNNQRLVRPGVLLRANCNATDGKPSSQKLMLEFNSECFSNYQLLQVGGYYVMEHMKGVLLHNLKNHCHVTTGKTLVTSPLWRFSFSSDEHISPSELLQKYNSQNVSIQTDVVPCGSSFNGDLFIQRSPSQSPEVFSGDIVFQLSVAARNLLNLDMEAMENGLVKPISISGAFDNSSIIMMGPSLHSSGTADPGCRLPQGSLISVHGNVLDVHDFDCDFVAQKKSPSYNGTGNVQHKRMLQGLRSSICIHISKGHHIVKLRGTLSKQVYPVGLGPGVSATFHRVLVMGHHDLMLTPVSFIVINSIRQINEDYSESSHPQFGSGIISGGESLDTIPSCSFSELIQQCESNAMHFRCRVVAIHVLVLENKKFEVEISNLKEHSRIPVISVPCAGFILDDGSSPCCCWSSAGRAANLLRLDQETLVSETCSNSWRPNRSNAEKTPRTANYYLQKILKKHRRIIVKNYGAMFDSSCQDLTFAVDSDDVLSSSDETILKLIILNACCGPALNVLGTIMDSNAIGRLEEISGLNTAIHAMQNIWVTEVQYANPRTEASNLIQELMK